MTLSKKKWKDKMSKIRSANHGFLSIAEYDGTDQTL